VARRRRARTKDAPALAQVGGDDNSGRHDGGRDDGGEDDDGGDNIGRDDGGGMGRRFGDFGGSGDGGRIYFDRTFAIKAGFALTVVAQAVVLVMLLGGRTGVQRTLRKLRRRVLGSEDECERRAD